MFASQTRSRDHLRVAGTGSPGRQKALGFSPQPEASDFPLHEGTGRRRLARVLEVGSNLLGAALCVMIVGSSLIWVAALGEREAETLPALQSLAALSGTARVEGDRRRGQPDVGTMVVAASAWLPQHQDAIQPSEDVGLSDPEPTDRLPAMPDFLDPELPSLQSDLLGADAREGLLFDRLVPLFPPGDSEVAGASTGGESRRLLAAETETEPQTDSLSGRELAASPVPVPRPEGERSGAFLLPIGQVGPAVNRLAGSLTGRAGSAMVLEEAKLESSGSEVEAAERIGAKGQVAAGGAEVAVDTSITAMSRPASRPGQPVEEGTFWQWVAEGSRAFSGGGGVPSARGIAGAPSALDLDSLAPLGRDFAPSVQVVIHHAKGDRDRAAALAHRISAREIEARLRSVAGRVSQTEVRYFFVHDLPGAHRVAGIVEGSEGVPIPAPRDFVGTAPKPGPGTLEVWLSN